MARPEGFEPPTFGFEVQYFMILSNREKHDFPGVKASFTLSQPYP